MLYREIIAVCFEIHTKHINTLCGQNVQLLIVKLAVNKIITKSRSVKIKNQQTNSCKPVSHKLNASYFLPLHHGTATVYFFCT